MILRTGSSWPCFSAVVLALAFGVPSPQAADPSKAMGQRLAHDVYKGNCLACHQIPGDPSAVSLADIGPPLVDMRKRFPDRAALRSQVWDPTARNPQTVMPPFGKHKVLTEEEIDLIVDYIYQY
jgi:L-cysteine S-thiosulfotransferase